MNCYSTPDLLRMVDAGKPDNSFLTHIRSCTSCAHAYVSLTFSISAMDLLPDSPLFEDIPMPSASLSLAPHGFVVKHAGGFSLASPIPVRGKRRSAVSLISGPVILEPLDRCTFRIVISSVRRSCTLVRDNDVVYRTGQRDERVFISDLCTGSYRLTVDGIAFSFTVE
ncbi:MAG: hypothetical protein AABZ39_01150 [Spirochaetota bacterium]